MDNSGNAGGLEVVSHALNSIKDVEFKNEEKLKSDINICTIENTEGATEPPYVLEIEVNTDGDVVDKISDTTQCQNTDGTLPVSVYNVKEFDTIKSMHNYYQQPGNEGDQRTNSNDSITLKTENKEHEPNGDVELSGNTANPINCNVNVVYDSEQVIIISGSNCKLSESDIEAIKLQISKSREETQNTIDIGDVPVPEPSYFTEQTSSCITQDADIDKVSTCYQCKEEFATSDDLVYHFVQEHSTSVKCQYCEMVFPSIADANQHKKQRHIELICTMCKKTYNGTLALKQHVKLKHSKGTKCGTCYKYFDTRKAMEDHIELEHKVHKCRFCGKGFYFKTSLLNHTESEHGLSTFETNISFDNIDEDLVGETSNYQQSKQTDKAQEEVIPHDKTFADVTYGNPVKTQTMKHQNSISKEEKILEQVHDSSEMPHVSRRSPRKHGHKCVFCGKGFFFKTSLADHMDSYHDLNTVNINVILGTIEDDLVGKTNNYQDSELLQMSEFPEVNGKKIGIGVPPDNPVKTPKNIKPQKSVMKEENPSAKALNGSEIPYPSRKSPRKHIAENSPTSSSTSLQDKLMYSCEECNVSFKTTMESEAILLYTRHLANRHNDFLCKKCNIDYANYRSFMTHMKSKHEVSTDVLVCSYCSHEFRTRRTFDLHVKDNWRRCPAAVACTNCCKVFVSNQELTSHHKKEHEGKLVQHNI